MTECQDILDLIPGADYRTNKMLQKYAQLGLLFTYNIDEKQTFCYSNQILFSRFILKSLADTVVTTFLTGILVNSHSIQLNNMIADLCNIGTVGDGSLSRMSRCVSRAIITGIHSIDFVRDVSSLVQIKHTERKSSFRMTNTFQFTDFSNSQAKHVLECFTPTMLTFTKLLNSEKVDYSISTTNVVMGILEKKIEQFFHENMESGQTLHQQLCCLNGNSSSRSRKDIQQFVKCISDIVLLAMRAFHLSDADIQTAKLQFIAVELSRNGSIMESDVSSDRTIAAITEQIDIGIVLRKFSDSLVDQINTINQRMNADDYLQHDEELPEETYSVLTSTCSDIIRAVVNCSITHSLVFDLQNEVTRQLQSIYQTLSINGVLSNMRNRSLFTSQSSRRVKELYTDLRKERGLRLHSMTEARSYSRYVGYTIIIMDIDKETVIKNSAFQKR